MSSSPTLSSSATPIVQSRTVMWHRILVIGGGTAGLSAAARLVREGERDSGLIEPSRKHFYQPHWPLFGAGRVKVEATVREGGRYIRKGVRGYHDSAVEVDAGRNEVRAGGGT
jgi:sulfide:quinone oxidoreductase